MITIERYETPYGTFGELEFDGLKLHSLERKWLDNLPNKSCIPAGDYVLVKHDSPTHGETWAVVDEAKNVYQYKTDKGRWGILIHPANIEDELEGCIALGMRLSVFRGKWSIANSGKAVSKFFAKLADYDHVMLRITYKEAP